MIQFAVAFMAMFESCEMLLHNSFLCLVMGRGMGPRYLALKRERGPARVSRLLSEDIMPLYQLTSRPGTMKEHGYVILPSRQVGAVLGTRTCQPVLRGRQATALSTPW